MIADKIGNYKIVLMCSIVMMGAFHSLLLTIDAHGYPVQEAVSSSDNLSAVYINCEPSGRMFLEWPSCSNNTCLFSSLNQTDSVIVSLTMDDCYQSCGSELCFPEQDGCLFQLALWCF